MSGEAIRGSYLPAGTRAPFWSFYDDEHLALELGASSDVELLGRNRRLGDYLVDPTSIASMTPYAFHPPALRATGENSKRVGARMTGGRTFLLDRKACRDIGWPESVSLDLAHAGWGTGELEMRPEVKGAGTAFARTGLSDLGIRALLADDPERFAEYLSVAGDDPPLLMMSTAVFMKRPIGGQSEKCALQAVDTSSVQLGRSPIKFVPALYAALQPSAVMRDLLRFEAALKGNEARYRGRVACEVRFSPSSVRAVYFDSFEDEQDLAQLAANVSTDRDELQSTLEEMIKDARRYLELMLSSTLEADDGRFTWIKVGDVHEKFSTSGSAHLRRQRYAWFLVKDEVVVRRAGKFFTDMESYFGRDVGYTSPSWEALAEHQALFVLVILRISRKPDMGSANSRTVVSLMSGQFGGVGPRVPCCVHR